MSAIGINLVAKYLDSSEWLEDLDVSWNDLMPLHFNSLLEVVSRNRHLKSLNLSWNMMIDKNASNNTFSFKVMSAMEQLVAERQKVMEKK